MIKGVFIHIKITYMFMSMHRLNKTELLRSSNNCFLSSFLKTSYLLVSTIYPVFGLHMWLYKWMIDKYCIGKKTWFGCLLLDLNLNQLIKLIFASYCGIMVNKLDLQITFQLNGKFNSSWWITYTCSLVFLEVPHMLQWLAS